MSLKTIYCAGPSAFPEDRWQLLNINDRLIDGGFRSYVPFRDGLDTLYPGPVGTDDNNRLNLARSIFAFNVCQLIQECDAVLFSMNGRIPDEGGLIVTALAAMTGIPVILYKQDHRSTFHGFDNSMITGLCRTFSTISNPEKICAAITHEIKKGKRRRDPSELPPAMADAVALGEKLSGTLVGQLPLIKDDEADIIHTIFSIYDNSGWAGFQSPVSQPEDKPGNSGNDQGPVYCSGALFCQGEVNVMAGMAHSLEGAGWDTYLPHRDGVEAFVMKNTNNFLANLVRPLVRFMHRLTFATDVFYILKCHCLVFNLNGRVPDEGGVAEVGMAFAAGKPVLIYHEPLQAASTSSGDHLIDPMIIGTMALSAPAVTIAQISEQLGRINKSSYWTADLTGETGRHSPHMQKMARLGHGAVRFMKRISFLKPKSIF